MCGESCDLFHPIHERFQRSASRTCLLSNVSKLFVSNVSKLLSNVSKLLSNVSKLFVIKWIKTSCIKCIKTVCIKCIKIESRSRKVFEGRLNVRFKLDKKKCNGQYTRECFACRTNGSRGKNLNSIESSSYVSRTLNRSSKHILRIERERRKTIRTKTIDRERERNAI